MFDFGADGGPLDGAPSVQTDILDSADLICQYVGADGPCTVPLPYGGRGRRPVYCADHKGGRDRTESSSSRTNTSSNPRRKNGAVPERELEQACNNLRLSYEAMLKPLMLVSPVAAGMWEAEIDSLDKSNHTFLANNRKLVQRLNTTGQKLGLAGFIFAHVSAIAPVTMVAYADLTFRFRKMRAAMPAEPQPSHAYDGTVFAEQTFAPDPPTDENTDAPVYDIDAAFRK